MLKINNVNKYFNKGKRNEIHVINNTTLTLPDNGLVALLGESGCGKTTMLNVIGGLDRIKSGSIYFNNQRISSGTTHQIDKVRNLHIGYIFQDYKLIDDLSVFDNVAIALKLIGIKDKNEVKKRVEYVLDKVGILRYRYRPAGTLSGGERQRVGIARALVKNPDIILADEPTGNLDSKNSVEIMNIIKRISKDRLVILVTHERPLAYFYASRIIELVDGKVVSDKENTNSDSLNYELENTFYLKDFKNQEVLKDDDNEINIYSDTKEKIKVNLIIKNGNIYIESKDNKKVEVIDDNSVIEVVDSNKKEISKEELYDYDFDMASVENQKIRKRYSSIFNPFSSIKAGFKKVFSFSVLKKLLLLGFVVAGIFMVYSVGGIGATLHTTDDDFVQYNQNYIMLEKRSMSNDEYLKLLENEGIKYIIPGDSKVSFKIDVGDYYQTLNTMKTITGSLSSNTLLTKDSIILGRMPENSKEIVVDEMIFNKLFETDHDYKMIGINDINKILNRKLSLNDNKLEKYTIVGISSLSSPSIYVDDSEFLNILQYSYQGDMYYGYYDYDMGGGNEQEYTKYELYGEELTLTRNSSLPINDYEVLLPESYSYEFKIGQETSFKINDIKLKVSGFYTNEGLDKIFVNENTIKCKMLGEAIQFIICTDYDDKGFVVSSLVENGYVSYDLYETTRTEYETSRRSLVKSAILVAAIFIAISLLEIFLMTRSSFLSRIKEVGTLRAIGAKKFDVYLMFFGEIFAITTLTSLPAMLIMYRIESFLVDNISYFIETFYMPIPVLIAVILFIYIFNIVIGLIPVFSTMLKKPAAILSRYDVD